MIKSTRGKPKLLYRSNSKQSTPTAIKVNDAIKKAAKDTREAPQNILAEAASLISDATAARLTAVRSQKRKIRRVRTDELEAENIHLPKDLESIQLPEDLKKTTKGELFLLFDSGPETKSERIVVFGTKTFLDLLVSAEEIF